jgi:DNA-binding XRE family transcriptional regulator
MSRSQTTIKPNEIRLAREAARLTQSEAAALLGVTRVAWNRYEAGVRSLSEPEWAYWLHVTGLVRIPFRKRPT